MPRHALKDFFLGIQVLHHQTYLPCAWERW